MIYPIFIGFLPAKTILKVAEAPSFDNHTEHSTIARNVLRPPIKNWQRPVSRERVEHIKSFFNNSGEIMPNPVLLSENGSEPVPGFRVSSESEGKGDGIWIIEIPEPRKEGAPKPLWILDGQHRITGLALSNQADNPVPLVLLMNQDVDSYKPRTFAKLFAQVTTSAQQLSPLHDEWLTYAFDLKSYSDQQDRQRNSHNAMEATARLCELQSLDSSGATANPFYDRVRFNPFSGEPSLKPTGGGFEYTCRDMKDLIQDQYFDLSKSAARLSPEDLARQVGLAYCALYEVVGKTQPDSVFFGDSPRAQKPMQDAFLVGVMAYLRNQGAPSDWSSVLSALQFGSTDWNFSLWVATTGGSAGNLSKTVAWTVMRDAFEEAKLPAGNTNLADYLHGNSAQVRLTASRLTAGGSRSALDRVEIQVTPGVSSRDIADRPLLKLEGVSRNIAKLTIVDRQAPLSDTYSHRALRRGVMLGEQTPNPLGLLLKMDFYGGLEQQAQVSIKWKAP